mmetsp:Transcript_22525/g.51111  ORF Transcript_22525/g.51111 Transcript_22525/m.51111 type:complete len:157 (+) Transcript_22525:97-567(+)
MTASSSSSPSCPACPAVAPRPRSRSFGQSTPTFSSDLAKLTSTVGSCQNSTVPTYQEAITIAKSFDVLGPSSPLSRKVSLDTESDWINFIDTSGAVDCTAEERKIEIHLEKFLRYCFDIAYKMPPSPSNKALRSSMGTASENGMRQNSNSPTPLNI